MLKNLFYTDRQNILWWPFGLFWSRASTLGHNILKSKCNIGLENDLASKWVLEGISYLASNGFFAGSTNAFGDSLDTQTVEVWLQAAQHVIQFIPLLWNAGGGTLALSHNLQEKGKEFSHFKANPSLHLHTQHKQLCLYLTLSLVHTTNYYQPSHSANAFIQCTFWYTFYQVDLHQFDQWHNVNNSCLNIYRT